MPSTALRTLCVVSALVLALSACSQPGTCSNEKEVAEKLARLSADVQAATLSNKLSMDQLKQLTIRVDTAGSHYSARKDPAEYCSDLDSIREDFKL